MECPPTILLYLPGAEGHAARYTAHHLHPGWMAILFRIMLRYHRQAVMWVAILEWCKFYEIRMLEIGANPVFIRHPDGTTEVKSVT